MIRIVDAILLYTVSSYKGTPSKVSPTYLTVRGPTSSQIGSGWGIRTPDLQGMSLTRWATSLIRKSHILCIYTLFMKFKSAIHTDVDFFIVVDSKVFWNHKWFITFETVDFSHFYYYTFLQLKCKP